MADLGTTMVQHSIKGPAQPEELRARSLGSLAPACRGAQCEPAQKRGAGTGERRSDIGASVRKAASAGTRSTVRPSRGAGEVDLCSR